MGMLDVVDHVKEIAALADAYNHRDLFKKIVDLQGEVLSISEENMKLAARVRELEDQEKTAGEIVKIRNFYYRKIDDGGVNMKDPFCIPCWDGDRKLIHVYSEGSMKHCGRCRILNGGKIIPIY